MGDVVAGVRRLVVDGQGYDVEGEPEYSVQTKEYEEIIGSGGKSGDSEKGVSCYIQATVLLEEGVSQSVLQVRNKEITLELADRTVTLFRGTLQGTNGVNGGKNSYQVRYTSRTGREVF